MSTIGEFIENNAKYASTFDQGGLPMPPANKMFILICQDARINPADALGLNLGECHVVRNAGGRAQDAIRSIVISQRALGTRQIAVFHHTDCGMMKFTTDEMRATLLADSRNRAAEILVKGMEFLEFSDPEASVREDVEYLKTHPLVLEETEITGWVYHVEDGKISRVV